MADEAADDLRDMALHRGFKLVRSRRRKPGTGDYGRFGLTDASGNELIGFGDEGLTASAAEIEDYLRAGAASTWQQSARITPERKATTQGRSNKGASDKADGSSGKRPNPPSKAEKGKTEKAGTPKDKVSNRSAKAPTRTAPEPPKPEPVLTTRAAKPSDAEALAHLLSQLAEVSIATADAANHMASLRKAGGGVHLAELGAVVGCVGWAIVPTPHRGLVGRITVLIVDQRHRRRGIARQLLAEAEAALGKKGCTATEAMSDIDLKNSHGFFRAVGFAQKSYRFVREIEKV